MSNVGLQEFVNPVNTELFHNVEGVRTGIVSSAADILNVGKPHPHNMFRPDRFEQKAMNAATIAKNPSLDTLKNIDLKGKTVDYQGQVHGLIGALERQEDPNTFDAIYTMQATAGLNEVTRFIASSKAALTTQQVPFFTGLDGRYANNAEVALAKKPKVNQTLSVVYQIADGLDAARYAKPESNAPFRANRREAVAAVFAMADALNPDLTPREKDTLMQLTRKILSRNGNIAGIDDILSSIESEKAGASVVPVPTT